MDDNNDEIESLLIDAIKNDPQKTEKILLILIECALSRP